MAAHIFFQRLVIAPVLGAGQVLLLGIGPNACAKDAPCIPAIEDDFQRTLTQCRTVEATTQSIWQGQTLLRLTGRLVKAIAPLL